MSWFIDYISALQGATSLNHLIPEVGRIGPFSVTRRGDLVANLKIRGIYSSLMTEDELRQKTEAYEHARARSDEDFVLYEYLHKQEFDGLPMRGNYGNDAVAAAVSNRAAFLKAKGDALYSIDLYLSILLLSSEALYGNPVEKAWRSLRAELWMKDRLEIAQSILDQSVQRLQARVNSFVKQTANLLDARLLPAQESFHFLRSLVNLDPGLARAVRLHGDTPIDEQLVSSHIDFDKDTNTLREGRHHVAVLTLVETPKKRGLDIYRSIREIPVNTIICSEGRRHSKAKSRRKITWKKRFHYSNLFNWYALAQQKMAGKQSDPNVSRMDLLSEEEAEGSIHQLKAAGKYLLDEGNYFTDYRLTVILYSKDEEKLRKAKTDLIGLFDEKEATLVEETLGVLLHRLGILPGNYTFNKRRKLMLPISASAECSPVYAVPGGNVRNEHLRDEYLLPLETNHNTIYYLNLHERDVLTALVIGAMGSGKTFFLQITVISYAKYGGFIFVMDLLGNFRDVAHLLGGIHTSMTSDRDQIRLNPFLMEPTPANLAMLETLAALWIEGEMPVEQDKMTAEQKDEVRQAIHWTVNHSNPEMRRLSMFASFLTGSLSARMKPWLNSIFDNKEDDLREARVMSFDFQSLQKDPRVLTPVLFYVMAFIDNLCRKPEHLHLPKLLIADEVFVLAENREIARYLVEFPRLARNFNGGIILASQSAMDFDKLGRNYSGNYSEQGNRELVFEIFKTHLIFPSERMNPAAYQERLGLNEKEAQAAAQMQAKKQFLLRKGDEPAVILNLNVDEETRLMLSTKPLEKQLRIAKSA
jgi:type IV secretory pathway VirB4 component